MTKLKYKEVLKLAYTDSNINGIRVDLQKATKVDIYQHENGWGIS